MAGIDLDALACCGRRGRGDARADAELFPICRSLTGDGVRETFAILERDVPLEITEIPSGTKVFDWTLPREWNIRDAWIAGPDGTRVVDFRRSNLHVLGYSVPIRTRLPLSELRDHLLHASRRTLTGSPIERRTTQENWGFCLSRRQLEALPDGEYEVVIDSSLTDGSVLYAEATSPGRPSDEVLFSTYVCHPSLCNDNLSGIVLTAALARYLRPLSLRNSYRFLLARGRSGRSRGCGRTRRASGACTAGSSCPAPATRGR